MLNIYYGNFREKKSNILGHRSSQVVPVVQNSPVNVGDSRDLDLIPGSGRSLEEEVETTPIFLHGKFHGQRRPEGYSPWDCKKSWT